MPTPTWSELIAEHFNLKELPDLCYKLAMPFDELGEGGGLARARELMEHMERRGRTAELLAMCSGRSC